jgi:hypothetical protein
MEHNTPRLVDLLDEFIALTFLNKVTWQPLDDGRSYQYEGPRMLAVILSLGENDEGPYVLSLRSGKDETAYLDEATTSDRNGPETWNGMLAYLFSLAKRASQSSAEGYKEDLGLPSR